MSIVEIDTYWMQAAIGQAQLALEQGEVPVGAVVVYQEHLIGQGYNAPISRCDPSAHAEIIALRAAAQYMGNYRLPGSVLYVTLAPCLMCQGALLHARVARVVYGAEEQKLLGSKLQYTAGVEAERCRHLLQQFFAAKR
jgi:tRNA(adenine34) deaminase